MNLLIFGLSHYIPQEEPKKVIYGLQYHVHLIAIRHKQPKTRSSVSTENNTGALYTSQSMKHHTSSFGEHRINIQCKHRAENVKRMKFTRTCFLTQ